VGGEISAVTIRLRGDRVVLRPFAESEFDALWREETKDRGEFDRAWQKQDEAARERVRARVTRSGSWREGKVLDLAVEADGALIGDVQVRHAEQMAPPGLYELGIGLFTGSRGKGYGTETVRLITRYLFDEERAMRVQLGTDVENMSMRRVAEKAGFRFEGVMRGFWTADGEAPRDYALYARTRSDHEG
jgi:RimJ/RimL family protein N-acetyltransferase